MKIKNLYSLAIVVALSLFTFSSIASNKLDLQGDKETVVVSGIITNKKGKAIKGAAIKSLNNNKYTLTDKKGYYQIETQPDSQLIVSYIGYTSDTINIAKSQEINLQLYTKEDLRTEKQNKTKKGNWFGGIGIGASTTF